MCLLEWEEQKKEGEIWVKMKNIRLRVKLRRQQKTGKAKQVTIGLESGWKLMKEKKEFQICSSFLQSRLLSIEYEDFQNNSPKEKSVLKLKTV